MILLSGATNLHNYQFLVSLKKNNGTMYLLMQSQKLVGFATLSSV